MPTYYTPTGHKPYYPAWRYADGHLEILLAFPKRSIRAAMAVAISLWGRKS